MLHFVRRSLLVQLLSVYLLFVVIVLLGGVGVNAVVEQQLRNDAQASDQALGQEIALETGLHLRDAENALIMLGKLVAKADTTALTVRDDEVGGLARSLVRLERDGLKKLGELRTLLETSNAVVRSLEVRITAERRDDTVIVSALDNGPGIDPDELSHVFERFYRARHGRQQHSGGTGLGLAICKAFIEAHGGTIWAESSMHGTTISFSLPLVPPTTSAMSVDTAATKLSRVEPL